MNEQPAGTSRTDVSFVTTDGLTLTGFVTAVSDAQRQPGQTATSPGVVLVHQFMRDDEQWGVLPETLAEAGYTVLAFNLRGHGDSDAYDNPLADLLTDSSGAPRDVEAALSFLGTLDGLDPTRLGLVGTSIGANLTAAASVRGIAATYVTLTARLSAVEILAEGPAVDLASVFYIVAENESPQNADAQTMFDMTAKPRDLLLVQGTSDHGIALLDNHDEVTVRIIAWLADTL
jgi:hypothetical protein